MRPLIYLSFVLALFAPSISHSQALQLVKPYTGAVNKAVANTITSRMVGMGFAANDPVFVSTLAASELVLTGAVAAGSVAATIGAVGSSPVWLSVALGLGAVYEIYDFTMGSVDFKGVPDQAAVTLAAGTIQRAPPVLPVYSGPLNSPSLIVPTDYADPGPGNLMIYPNDQKMCARNTTGQVFCGNTVEQLEDQFHTHFLNSLYKSYVQDAGLTLVSLSERFKSGPTKQTCTLSITCPDLMSYWYSRNYQLDYVDSYGSQANAFLAYNFYVFNNPKYYDTTKQYRLNDAVAKLADPDLASSADLELIAAIVNKLWQQAAQQPGYEGAPYDVQNPITSQEVLAMIQAGVFPWPSVADLLSPTSTAPQVAPVLDPAAAPVTAPAPSGDVSVDFGPDPGVPTPALEDAPSGLSIVSKVMGLLPSFTNYHFPAHLSQCEFSSFELLGAEFSFMPYMIKP